ncbi:MAG: hypothetical protein IBJ03_10855 [Gemmatimonadaceae bacterium]|nr:hypothetical protein [Gemmatimonadaceae bacterium]
MHLTRWLVGSLLMVLMGVSHAPASHSALPSIVRITFVAESAQFANAATEYTEIWKLEGPRIIAATEQATGLRFDAPSHADTAITVIVFEGVSQSGDPGKPMRLRASYPEPTKRATLAHELGHRLQVGIARDEDEHEVLFLWLYDVWTQLWGREFADAQVLIEKARRGPYPKAWDAALARSASERAEEFRSLRVRNTPQR